MLAALRGLVLCALVLLLVGPVLGACGFSPTIGSGNIGCSDAGACPPGFSCATNGQCYSGLGPACAGGLPCPPGRDCVSGMCVCAGCDGATSDGCSASGGCQCGSGAACGKGQQCVAGQCVCNAASCPTGCCSNDTCEPGTTAAQCGGAGKDCQACPSGQACDAGVCTGCECPGGCCTGLDCHVPSAATCGADGKVCFACDATKADGCAGTGGTCTCGGAAACGAGQRCAAGLCVCDATSCPDGCCDGSTCQTR
jgi:hypothetical protein